MSVDMQDHRRRCYVAGEAVCADAKDAHFEEHIVRVMGGEMHNPSSPLVRTSFGPDGTCECCEGSPPTRPLNEARAWLVTWERGPVLKGHYRVISKGSGVWVRESHEEYVGEPLTDPSWEDLAVEAERQIRCTGDWHHIYLEGANVVASDLERLAAVQGEGVLDIHLCMRI